MKLKRIISSMLAAVLLLGTLQVLPAGAAENARYAEFENPSIDYKSRPLWFWNVFGDSATMDKQRLIDTVNGSLESGYSGFGILPYGQGGYLGDDYFDMYRTVLEACKKNGMKLNLYDENGFPSGPAGGLFQQTYPEDTSKALYKTEKEVTGPVKGKMAVDLGTENEPLMGAVAMNVDTKEIIELTAVSEEMQQMSFTTTASSYFTLLPGYTADMATDGNPATRWNAGDRSGNDEWLQLEFEQPVTFDSAVISEAYDRTTSYHIQYWDGSGWVNASEGNTIGASKTDSFAPVTSNKVRLYIDTIVDPDVNSVTIWEFDLQKDGQSVLRTGGDCVNYDLGEGTWKVMAFNLRRDGNSFCDYLDAEDVRKFISITHDAYYDQFAEYFGDVIDMTFYDEPALWRSNTWTEKYNEKFEEEYGFDPVKYYPALWYDIGEDTAFARSTLFDFRAELFADSWTKTLADWCDEHNIDLTGHVGEEELINPTNTVGDLMKAFRSQDIPGIDEVIFYGRISRALKVVSSSANNWDKQKVMVEIHGADDNLDIPTLYRDVMDHFAKGINLMVPHAVWYTPYGAGFMNPELSYRDPYWGPALPDYNDFIGRSASILQQEGQHVADIGVLYPIDSLHNGFVFDGGYDPYKGGVTPQAEWNYMDLGEMLSLDIRRDFTYLHPDIIDERCSVEGDTFKLNNEVNYEQYKVILLPGCDTISVSNLEKIKEFYDGGGLVIGTRQLPYQSSEQGQSARVVELIKEMFGVDPRSSTGPIYTSSSQYEVQWMGDTIGLEPWKAGDDDLGTRWESNGSTNEWLEVNFAQPQQIAKAVISEYAKAVTSYRLEYWDEASQDWVSLADGSSIGSKKTHEFDAVTASKVRLSIPSAANRISISEFRLYGPDGSDLIFPESVSNNNAVYLPNASAKTLEAALDSTGMQYDVQFDDNPSVTGGNLSYLHKVVDGADYYYIANSSDNSLNTTVTLRGTLDSPAVWNPHNGEKYSVPAVHTTENGEAVTKVNLRISPVQALFLVDDSSAPEKLFTDSLSQALETARQIDADKATPASYALVSHLMQRAEKLLADSSATQEQIDACESQLREAVAQIAYLNLAYQKPVTVSSSLDGNNFHQSYLTDGNHKTMYSSSGNTGVQHEEWAVIDLGAPSQISRVDLVPRSDSPYEGLFYPIDFQIQVSEDNEQWTTVSTIQNESLPTDCLPRTYTFDQVTARYVRVLATKLNIHPGIDPNYRFQLSEIEVYGPQAAASDADKTILSYVLEYARQVIDEGGTDNLIPLVQAKFNSAFHNALAVQADPASTQQQVDQAWVMLLNAIHMLDFVKGDKAALGASITAAQGLNPDDYQDASAMLQALDQAVQVYEDENALQSEVDAAREALDREVSALVLKDKTELIVLLGQADTLEQDRFVESGWTEFETAREAARQVLDNPKSTQQQIDAAADSLLQAMLGLRYKADKNLLQSVYDEASTIDLSGYTGEPLERFLQAKADAAKLLEDDTLTAKEGQSLVDGAAQALRKAIDSLTNPDAAPVEGDAETQSNSSAPKTGDASASAVALMLLTAAAAVVLKKRRR